MTGVSQVEAGRPLVLVIDDDPDLRTLATIELSDDFGVIAAEDGRRGVELARAQNPDVVLLDMLMPGMDGAQVLDALKSDESTSHIPVIFLSALSDLDQRVAGLDSGAVDWITKPYEARELRARVAAAARRGPARWAAAPGRDPVTGLHTEDSFLMRLKEEQSRSRRNSQPFSLLLIEIDDFDDLDREGVGRGNAALRDVATVLRSTLRASDRSFRRGDGEFAALLPDADVATAALAAERLMRAFGVEGRGTATLSVGVAEHSAGRGGELLLDRATAALQRARESGGDQAWRADDPRRSGTHPSALSQELTPREWDVLTHLSQRRTEDDIGRRLGISPGTVRSHKARIRRKLSVHPDVRLADFVRDNFGDILERRGPANLERS
jgi:diguanylate cyclase (GGDEF)-like protein